MSTTNLQGSSLVGFTSRALICVGLVAMATVCLFLLWWARHIVFLTITGILLAIFLNAVARGLERFTRLRYGWCVAISVLAIVGFLALVGWLIGARVSDQIGELAQELPKSAHQIEQRISNTPIGQAVHDLAPQNGKLELIRDVMSQAATILGSVAEAIADAIVVLFVGLYGAAQPGWYRRGLLHLVPLGRRDRAEQILDAVVYKLRWWLLGQLLAMVLIGLLVALGLWLVGLELPLALGVLAFLLEIVPYAGPFLSLIPALLLAGMHGLAMVAWVLVVFTFVHVIEGYVAMPLVQVRAIRLSPAVYLITVLLFFWLGGILGVLVAAPSTIAMIVLVRMLYVEDTLGDWEAEPSEARGRRTASLQQDSG